MSRVRSGGSGGPQHGAGRPRSDPEMVRRNRVVIMLTDGEFAKLQRLAEERNLPLGTCAYEFVGRGLARRP
jgi:hypothetical protein